MSFVQRFMYMEVNNKTLNFRPLNFIYVTTITLGNRIGHNVILLGWSWSWNSNICGQGTH